jgi:hypothetical protein
LLVGNGVITTYSSLFISFLSKINANPSYGFK